MKFENVEVAEIFPVKPEVLCRAWMDSKEHSAFTGDNKAVIDRKIGGKFTAWGGYISGRTLELDSPKRILQEWRTTDFSEDEESSSIEVLFTPEGPDGTKLMIMHSRIPPGQGEGYGQGWIDFYFTLMKKYFV
jgi:activator of HSP90 ATPase